MTHIARKVLPLILFILSVSTLATYEENNAWQSNIGLNFNFARYRFGNLPRLDGYLAGLHWDFSHSWPSNWYTNLQFDGNWNAGPVSSVCCDNNGCDCSCNCNCPNASPTGCPDLRTSIRDFRPELDFGYNFIFCENEQFALTPFIGVGFLYLSNALRPQNITYRYFNVNVPIGLNLLWVIDEDCFDIGFCINYRIDAWTRLKLSLPCINMSDVTCNTSCDCNPINGPTIISGCANDCDNSCNNIKLHRTQGVHIAVPIRWHGALEDRCIDMQTKVVPFFDWNRFGCTTACNENGLALQIPQLKQWYLGLHVDFGINF